MSISFIGKGFMNILPYVFVKEESQNLEEQRRATVFCFIVYAIVGIVLSVVDYIFMKDVPSTTKVNKEDKEDNKQTLKEYINNVLHLFRNKAFLKYLVVITFTYIGIEKISSALNIAIVDFGFTQEQGSFSILLFYILGLLGSLLYDFYLAKQKREKFFLVTFTIIG